MSVKEYYRDFYSDLEKGCGYDPSCEPTFHERIETAIKIIGPAPKRILDFGCGSGNGVKRFLDVGHHVTGVDISESGIRLAKEEVPSARFELIDSEIQVPFPDQSFDVCFSSEVLEHLVDI